MVMLGVKADRSRNDAEIVGVVRQVAWAAERIYVPASISTLVFGLTVAAIGAYWSSLWIILGLIGIASTIALGIVVLSPMAKKVESGFAQGGVTPDLVALCREILTIAKFDMVLLFTIIADMVIKPSFAEWPILLIMVLVLAGAAYLWLTPTFRKTMATT
jgi:hypothetical protein